MGRILSYMKKYWFLALLASAFMVGEVFVDLLQPRLMEIIVDRGILGLDRGGVPDPGLVVGTMSGKTVSGTSCIFPSARWMISPPAP